MTFGRKTIVALRAMIAGGAACILMGGAGLAQSLKEARAREADERILEGEAAYTQSVCGHSLTAVIDWRSTANWPEGVSVAASCDGALGALEAICRERSGRNRARRITRFVCAGDGAGPSLRGGELRYGASPGENSFPDTKALLDSAL